MRASRGRSWALGLAGVAAGVWLASRMRTSARHRLRDKVVLITGGTRGLGLELAREIGGRGARVVVCGRDPEALERAAEDLRGRGVRVLPVQCDVTRPEQVSTLLGRIRGHWGDIDVLINNAGRIEVGPALHMTAGDHDAALDLHYRAPLRLIQAVLPAMLRREQGHIVNISSIGGRMAVPHLLPYTATKFALTGLSRGLRVELAKTGITVTTVFPGLMRTGSPPHAHFKGRHRDEYVWFELADSLPVLSIPVTRAARRIRRALERGETEVVVGLPAKVALAVHDRLPGVTYAVWSGIDRFLPGTGGIGTDSRLGRDSRDGPMLRFERRAEESQNQVLEDR